MKASVNLKNESWQKTFHAALMGGAYVGMACLLSFTLGGNMFRSYSAQMAVFAALFPVNLLLILQSGAPRLRIKSWQFDAICFSEGFRGWWKPTSQYRSLHSLLVG